MNSSERKTKIVENICPIFIKRNKTSTDSPTTTKLPTKFTVEKENSNPATSEYLNLMGLGMLSSDESSNSAASAFAPATSGCFVGDENSNEATPNLDAPKLQHIHIPKSTILNDSITDNACFLDPNETLKSATSTTGTTNVNNNVNTRSPLVAIMSNNRTQTTKSSSQTALPSTSFSFSNSRPSTSSDALGSIKKQIFSPADASNFFLYKSKSSKETTGPDPFSRLSDEVILEILKWLPKKALIRCSSVCRRFNQLAADESLWTRLDLGGKYIRAGALSTILSRGVIIFRLAQCEIIHPAFEKRFLESYPHFQSKLQYLDLSMATITKPSLKMILSRCKQIKKLSLELVAINDEICDEIAKNIHLESLNLAMCEGLQSWSVRHLMTELVNLNSLNISWTWLSIDAINALVSTITPNLIRLNMAGCRKTMFDSHLLTLSKRCQQLVELDLSDCTGLTSEAMKIVFNFQDLAYLSLSRCYGISATAYMDLNKLPSLQYLDVFGILSENALQMLEHSFPNIGINKFIHSSVARPTVGTRRTSIWGLRTRD